MHITSTALPMWGSVSPAHIDGEKIERAAFVRLEAT